LHASRQLKENEKNYSPFLLEAAAAVWGMDNFNEYLKGSQFTLYADEMPVPELGTTQTKTWNQLRTSMNKHKFLVQNRQRADLPEHLKHCQHHQTGVDINQINTLLFIARIHVDLLATNLGNTIITMNTLFTHYRLSFKTTVKKNCSKLFQKIGSYNMEFQGKFISKKERLKSAN
jgi:hypothetical protein